MRGYRIFAGRSSVQAGLPGYEQRERVLRALKADCWSTAADIAAAAELSFDQVSTILRKLFREKVAERLERRFDRAPLYRAAPRPAASEAECAS